MKKQSPFVDLGQQQFNGVRDAIEQRDHLKLVRATARGGEDEAGREAARLTQDYVDVTDSASLVISYLKMPGPMRDGVDAVIGAVGVDTGFVEVTDEVLAERMGKSPKSVQRWRDEFRKWNDHGALIEIKDHWRHPETGESHAHAYRCNITQLAVEAALEARLDAGYASDPARRRKAMQDAAATVAQSAPGYPPRKPKTRKVVSDEDKVYRTLQTISNQLAAVAQLQTMVRNPDYDRLYTLVEEAEANFQAVRAAFKMGPMSTQDTDKEYVDTGAKGPPDVSAQKPCLDTPSEEVLPAGDGGQVVKVSMPKTVHSAAASDEESTTCETEALCGKCLRVVNDFTCPCGGGACLCSACRETIRRLRDGTCSQRRLGLHRELPPFSYWTASEGADFDAFSPARATDDEEAKRVWGNLTARLAPQEGGAS